MLYFLMLFADFTPFVLFKPLKLICNVMICLSFLGAKVTEGTRRFLRACFYAKPAWLWNSLIIRLPLSHKSW